ncbi:DUF1835 domain-containing protein [Mucilaginibacter sp. X5P1]|uniref:DUF1835 domain-containing protein n=1 Tax=Mucilaginibacter sp. X5P1 TaxID=2723088 RepID=UPI001607A9C3|nr:DUF1835 domain-containing protein [Mucilaginibacter sp. X5P1]MBB6140246.1 hypothetical protein [Mucilaginibacter sp. X5P1]
MENVLHILNGDAMLNSFEQTGIEGDVMVWREVLSEGPLEENIASGSFWRKRSEWISRGFDEKPDAYEEKIINELSKLSEPYHEIDLWFEFDLHCQVNMLGVILMLSKQTDLSAPAVYLICPDSYPGMDDFRGMGELDEAQLEYLYDNIRVQLGEPDFVIAAEAWNYYVNSDATQLQNWLNETNYWGNLHSLKKALQAHVKRLEVNETGLNYIEQKLFDIYDSGITTRPEIYQVFWQTGQIYGMGDMELDIYLNHLKNKGLVDL